MSKRNVVRLGELSLAAIDYLWAHPEGASAAQIADMVGGTRESMRDRLDKIRVRGYVCKQKVTGQGCQRVVWFHPSHMPDDAEPTDAPVPVKKPVVRKVYETPSASGGRIIKLTDTRHVARDCIGSHGSWRGVSSLGMGEVGLSF